MDYSELDSVKEWNLENIPDEYLHYIENDWECREEIMYGKEIWEMENVQLYIDTKSLINDTCHDKHNLLLKHLRKENVKYNNTFYDLLKYNINVSESLICVNNGVTPIITTYVKLLLTYDKYNKLNILKNKTKLNNDIIFDIIFKYIL